MNTRPWLCPLFGMKSRPRAIRCRPRPLLEALEARLAPAVLLSYGGPGTVLGLLEQASAATPAVSISEPAVGQLDIDLDTQTFDAMSTAAAPGLTYEIPGSPTTSHFADIAIGQANNVTALEATLPGDALTLGVIASVSGGLGDIAASAGLITVTGVDTSNAGAGEGNVDLKAAGALTVARNTLLDTGTGTISLAADVNADGTGNSNTGALFIASGATVLSDNTSSSAITLRGAAIDIDTSADPGVVGAPRDPLPSTPSASLTGLSLPTALAFDAHGNLLVANINGTVSEFAPGSTTPTATLTRLNGPSALAFDARGDLFVANGFGTTVSEFAPGSTTPTGTLTGLGGPSAVAFDAGGNLFVANQTFGEVSEFAPGSTTPSNTLSGLSEPVALAFDARGDLFVANSGDTTVSEFAPGSTTPTATLTGLNAPSALAFDAHGNLFVANSDGTTVSEFAPGSTTPTATLSGLNSPFALAFDARGDLFVANYNGSGTVSEFAPGSTTPTATLTGVDTPSALAFDGPGNLFVANTQGTTVSEFALKPAAGGVVIRTAQPGQSISVGATAAGTGLAINNAELAQIFTSGAITFGDPSQTGTITFAAAITPSTSVVALQSPTGPGTSVLDDASGTALAVGTGNVNFAAGSGGIVTTGSDTTAAIASTGQVTLDTTGGVGSSAHRLGFGAAQTPSAVVVGDTSAPGSGVYLSALGALTLGDVRTTNAPLDVTAAAALTVAPKALLDTGTGTISLAADVNADGTGNSNSGKLSIAGGATVLSDNTSKSAITLRGAKIDIDTGDDPAVVGARLVDQPTTLSATLTGLNQPHALAVDASNNLFVANFTGNTVSEFAPGSTTPTATLTGLSFPGALAFDADGNLFVANLKNNTVSEFAPGSTTPTATLTGLYAPSALAFDARGNLFVANGNGIAVSEFAPGSTTPTATLTGLDAPSALAFDSRGNLFVANIGGTTVSEFAPGSTAPTATLTGLNDPGALAFDASGNLFVANNNNTVSKFAPGGTTPTETLSGLNDPSALAFDASGNLFVANGKGTTVSEFAPGSTTPNTTLSGLVRPDALAFDGRGNLFVANQKLATVSEFASTRPVPAAGGVVIRTAQPGQSISIGVNSGTGLAISNAALAQIFTTASGTITFGDPSQTGDVDVTGNVSSHPGFATLSLQTQNGSINEANGATITVANLVLQAGTGIGNTGDLHTAVTNLAFANRSGAIHISNTGAVTLTNVDTLIGSSIPGNIDSSSVVGTVYTLLHSSGGVKGQISYNGQALAEGTTLILSDGNRYQISYKANGGQDVTLTRIAGTSLHLATQPVAAVAGRAFVNLVMATFTDSNPNATPPDFTAAIDWGDGYNTVTTVTADGRGGFDILGTHTYLAAGSYTFSVQVTDSGGATATATGTAVVTGAGADPLGQTIRAGQAAGIGFWANPKGQALIQRFNGGPTSQALASWLAATLPNLYGAGTGPHDVTGLTNARVADLVRKLSRARPSQPETQVLATALDVYATTRSLGGTAARHDGFRVTTVGLGATAYTLGARAAALGVRSQTVLDVDRILAAANERAVDAVLDNGNATLRRRVNELFTEINTGT